MGDLGLISDFISVTTACGTTVATFAWSKTDVMLGFAEAYNDG